MMKNDVPSTRHDDLRASSDTTRPASDLPVVVVPLAQLSGDLTPRLSGLDTEHVELLAETEAGLLPPILVHEATMRIIDGAHRWRAAGLRGEKTISAVMFPGTDDEAYLLAIHANITHGLPLSLEDRKAAAVRILESYPAWSSRRVAAAAGLSRQTVSALREKFAATAGPVMRVGIDGRARPVSSAEGRLRAGAMIVEHPEASLREIAREVGVSPSTVRDVRDRLDSGRDPVPDVHQRDKQTGARAARVPPSSARRSALGVEPPMSKEEWQTGINRLKRDPSLRFNEAGRQLLRWLEATPDDSDLERVAALIPVHCLDLLSDMAWNSAKTWSLMAARLKERESGQSSASG